MVDLERWPHETGGVAESLHDAVRDAYSRTCEVLKSPGKHKAELAAAGVAILGTAVVITHATGLLKLGEAAQMARPVIDAADVISKARPGEASEAANLFGKIQHYFFDLDRTFFDTDKAYAAQEQELIRQLVKHTGQSESFVTKAVTETQKRLHSHFFAGRLDEIEDIQKLYPENLNEKFPQIKDAVRKAFYDALQPPADAVELLQYLKSQGKNVYAFTSGSPAHTVDKLQGSGLGSYFDRIFTAEKHPFEDAPDGGLIGSSNVWDKVQEVMKHPKESKEGYEWIIDYLHCKPQQGMMTGDDPLLDVGHAQEAGMHGTQATWYRNKPPGSVVPDFVARTAADLQLAISAAQ